MPRKSPWIRWARKGDYTGRRYTQVLARARPTIDNFFDNDKDPEYLAKWQRRYAWEFPWPLSFTAVKADDPQRTNYSKLPTVDELIAEMGADATARAVEAAAQKEAIAQGQGDKL